MLWRLTELLRLLESLILPVDLRLLKLRVVQLSVIKKRVAPKIVNIAQIPSPKKLNGKTPSVIKALNVMPPKKIQVLIFLRL